MLKSNNFAFIIRPALTQTPAVTRQEPSDGAYTGPAHFGERIAQRRKQQGYSRD